eukprot:1161141-Pelagomonas_calceolata.AAC.8
MTPNAPTSVRAHALDGSGGVAYTCKQVSPRISSHYLHPFTGAASGRCEAPCSEGDCRCCVCAAPGALADVRRCATWRCLWVRSSVRHSMDASCGPAVREVWSISRLCKYEGSVIPAWSLWEPLGAAGAIHRALWGLDHHGDEAGFRQLGTMRFQTRYHKADKTP